MPGYRPYELGLGRVAHLAGPCGRRERAKSQIAWPLIPTAAAQYCSSPDGRASRSEPPVALLGFLADLLTSFTSTSREFRFSRA